MLVHVGSAPITRLAAAVTIGVVSYVVLLAVNAPSVVKDARTLILRKDTASARYTEAGKLGVPAPQRSA
jgi:hypothetical protein